MPQLELLSKMNNFVCVLVVCVGWFCCTSSTVDGKTKIKFYFEISELKPATAIVTENKIKNAKRLV